MSEKSKNPNTIKNGGEGTFVGKVLRGIVGVSPDLLNILGIKEEKAFKAKLKNDFKKKKNFTGCLKGKLTSTNDGKLEIKILQGQESFRIKSFVSSNVWGVFKSGKSDFKKGELIECYSLNGANFNILK